MTIESQWILWRIGQFVVWLILPVVLMLCLRGPRRWVPRAALVTTICGFALVLLVVIEHLTIGAYSPLRSEISDTTDTDFVASAVSAWFAPIVPISGLGLLRWFSQLHRDATS